MNKLITILACCFVSFSALASDLEDLAKDGYAVIDETTVKGYDFEGCEYDKVIAFNNGLKFKCSEYSYHYSYNPEVYILKHAQYDSYKVIIDDEEFEGRLGR
ncbi:hypothetical protein ACTXMK_05240 [Psychrobacter celer]|uniref:hypothetical protein n=1 Tax=Psychrobacter celer TaxID=306572 RepID=UPI003FD1E92B